MQPLLIVGLLMSLSLFSACRPTVSISVLRPSEINPRNHGGTVTVQAFTGPHKVAESVVVDLRRRVVENEGGVVRYVRSGAGLLVHGSVDTASYRERIERRMGSCDRRSMLTEVSGNPAFPCRSVRRIGVAEMAITFTVTSRASGERLYQKQLTASDRAIEESDDDFAHLIDSDAMLEDLRRQLVSRFAKVLLPWREERRVRFGRCGSAKELCEQGVRAIREGEHDEAIAHFREALEELRESDGSATHRAGALWNLGLAQEYSGRFDEAEATLRRAQKLSPGSNDYDRELDHIEQLRSERSTLIEQGH